MAEIAERIAKNITREYGNIQTNKDFKKHIKEVQNHYGDHTESHLFHYIAPETFKNKKVLEIGCGFGGGVINLHKNGALAYGVDIDEDAIEIAKIIAKQEGINQDNFYIGVAENLPFDDETFDIVWSIQVLEHVQDPFKALTESIRVLKPKGIFFVHCPNYFYHWESHYRLCILPMMPKKLAKLYLKMRGRDTKFIDSINYITPQKIEKYLSKLPVKYENTPKERVIQKINDPKKINNQFFKKLFGTLNHSKLLFIATKMVKSLYFYYSTCVFMGQKIGELDEKDKNQ
jgi:ubiquinone/menaquinone biosynthesis C-methylase UbiE